MNEYIKKRFTTENFILFLIIIITFFPLLRVGFTVNDDLLMSLTTKSNNFFGFYKQFFNTLIAQGRPNFAAGISFYIPLAFDNFIYYKCITLGIIIINIFLVAYILKLCFKSNIVFQLSLLMSFAFLQNSWEHNPLTAFPGFITISISTLIVSFITFHKYLKENSLKYLYISIVLYIYTAFSYEIYVVYLPVFYLISYINNNKISVAIKKSIPHTVIAIIYLFIYVIFRNVMGSSYGGVQAQEHINVLNALTVIWQFSISTFPTYYFFNPKYLYLMNIYNDSLSNNIFDISNFRIEWIVRSLLISFLGFKLMSKIYKNNIGLSNNTRTIIFLVFGIAYIFIPVIPLSITSHYQEIVIKYKLLGMPVSYYCYLALIFSFVILIATITRKSKLIIYLITCGFFLASLFVDYSNYYISKYQAMSNTKWIIIDKFVQSEEYKKIPENSIVYAPSLWYQIGSVGINDTYWSDYLFVTTNKHLKITKDINELKDQNNSIEKYFLQFNQLLKDNEQYLVFSKINEINNGALLGDSVVVYNYSKYRDFTVFGKMGENSKNESVTLVNSNKTISTNGLFSFNINNNYYKENNTKKVNLVSKGIDLNTVSLMANGNNSETLNNTLNLSGIGSDLESSLITKGIYNKEANIRWMGDIAEVKLKSGEKGMLIFEGIIPEIIPNTTISIYVDEKLVVNQALSNGFFKIEKSIKKNEINNIRIESSESFVPSEKGINKDSRVLSLIINELRIE